MIPETMSPEVTHFLLQGWHASYLAALALAIVYVGILHRFTGSWTIAGIIVAAPLLVGTVVLVNFGWIALVMGLPVIMLTIGGLLAILLWPFFFTEPIKVEEQERNN